MRPISQTTPQKPSHRRPDDTTLYASLELSQATWLVTALSPGSEKMSKYSTLGGDGAALLSLLRRLQARAERLVGGPVDMSSFRKPGSTASGFTAYSVQMEFKATSSIPRRSPCHGAGGERRPTRSTARRC